MAAPAAPLGEPDPLEVEDLGDEERDDPGEQLGAGEDVHGLKLPPGAAGCNGPGGLFFRAGGPTPHGDAPRAARREQLLGIDLVGPPEEVLLRVVGGRAVDRTALGLAPFRIE